MITGWTFIRFMYLLLGGFIVIQSIMDHQWLGMFIGAYFGAMGLFGFGCASGACFGSMRNPLNPDDSINSNEDIQYDEIVGKSIRK